MNRAEMNQGKNIHHQEQSSKHRATKVSVEREGALSVRMEVQNFFIRPA